MINLLEIDSILVQKYPGLGVLESVVSNISIKKSMEELEAFKKLKQEEIRKNVQSLDTVRDFR